MTHILPGMLVPHPVINRDNRKSADSLRSVDLVIDGMHCAGCVGRVERALNEIPGVIRANVNLATETAHVQAPSNLPLSELQAAILLAGYQSAAMQAGRDAVELRKIEEIRVLRRDVVTALLLTLPVFFLAMGVDLIPAVSQVIDQTMGPLSNRYIQWVLTTTVLLAPGRRFFVLGLPALWRLSPDMNALVALGTAAAWGYSTVATFLPEILPLGTDYVYFEAACVIVSLILLGRYIEARAKRRASDAVRQLIGLQVKTATVMRGGEFHQLAIDDVDVGELVQVRPGEKIPLDGVVRSGHSLVDQSMISGEPEPVHKSPGAEVIGSTLNGRGAFIFEVTRVGSRTVLAQIIRMVEQAQGDKLPVQKLADQVTAWFVPAVMVVALATLLGWIQFGGAESFGLAWVNAVAVLIVACPCALGLATPTSIVVATGRGAQLGILFRAGDALERLQGVTLVAFDKTGTLTLGRPELTDFVAAEGFEEEDVLRLLASLESQSEHPVAAAIVRAAQDRGIDLMTVDNFEALAGRGASGLIDGQQIFVGGENLMLETACDTSMFAAIVEGWAAAGKTPIYGVVDHCVVAVGAVADPIKPSAQGTIAALRDRGIRVAMITGDHRGSADFVAASLEIDEVVAQVLPAGKVAALKAFSAAGETIAYIGDGINDAPALAQADVGIAVGNGTDVAISSADVVLHSDDLAGVNRALALSGKTMNNIRQNLFWAFAYNSALIPLAAGVFYPFTGWLLSPMWAAGAMAFSSLFVLVNALRLKKFRFVSQ